MSYWETHVKDDRYLVEDPPPGHLPGCKSSKYNPTDMRSMLETTGPLTKHLEIKPYNVPHFANYGSWDSQLLT